MFLSFLLSQGGRALRRSFWLVVGAGRIFVTGIGIRLILHGILVASGAGGVPTVDVDVRRRARGMRIVLQLAKHIADDITLEINAHRKDGMYSRSNVM